MRRLIRSVFPVSRIGMALWAWQHRSEIGEWASFAYRSGKGLVANEVDTDDVKAEARLRAGLARRRETRDLAIDLHVEDAVLTMTGRLTPEAHAAVQDVVQRTKGIRRVVDKIDNIAPRKRGLLRR